MCVHHAMCDGAGATKFLSSVAGFARGEDPAVAKPVWDRFRLLGPRNLAHVEVDFGDFLGFDHNGPYYDTRDGVASRECFHVQEVCLNRFRNQLKEGTGLSFTAFESLGAFVWRARVKAAGIDSNEVVKFAYSMNIAKIVKPELPVGYWGNVCVPVFVKLTARELIEQPISETAKLIKKSKHNVTDEYVRSYIDFQELHHAKGIAAGKFVSGFTDWRHLGHSDVDFGWGSPSIVLPLSWRILGSVEPTFFLPYAAEDERKKDGFKVLVCLTENAMAAFKLEMESFNS